MNMSLSTHNLRLLHDHLQGLISSHHMTWDWPQFLTWCVHNRVQDFNFRLGINIYHTHAIISRGLYIFYSIYSLGLILQIIYVLNKKIFKKKFINKSGFKSRAGYNGVCMICILYISYSMLSKLITLYRLLLIQFAKCLANR